MADKNTKTEPKPKAPKAAKTEQEVKPTPAPEPTPAPTPEPTPAFEPTPANDQAAKTEQDSPDSALVAEAATYLETLADPDAALLYLQARSLPVSAQVLTRKPGLLITARRLAEGVRVRMVANPDADMAARFDESSAAADRAVLLDQMAAAEKRIDALLADITARLVTVNSSEEWIHGMTDALLGDTEDEQLLAGLEKLDPNVLQPCREHVAAIEDLEDAAAKWRKDLKQMDAQLKARRKEPLVVLDKVYPADAEVALQIYKV